MELKYGIFFINGDTHQYGPNFTTIGLNKLHVQDFDTPDMAEEFAREHDIQNSFIIMGYYLGGM